MISLFRAYWKIVSLVLGLVVGCMLPESLSGQDSLWTVKEVTSNLPGNHPLRPKLHRKVKKSESLIDFQERKEAIGYSFAQKGYAEFNIDTFEQDGNLLRLEVHAGPRYFYDGLEVGEVDPTLLKRTNLEKWVRKQKPVFWPGLETELNYLLSESQNRGYPLARFDSLQMRTEQSGDSVLTQISFSYDAGPLIRIDSIQINGNRRESDKFVRSLIGIQKDDPFNQEAITRIPRVLNNSIYFRNAKPASIEFEESTANLIIDLEQRKAGKFDILLGLLPPRNDQTKFEFTGLADIQLVGPFFHAGEEVEFRFDKLVASSQKLQLRYKQPYLFGTGAMVEGEFNLMKQDTSFLNRYFQLAGYYAFSPQFSLKAWYRNKNSSLISTKLYEQDSINLPPVLDGSENMYGLGFAYENLDYRFNPTRGLFVKADFGFGIKKIRKNTRLSDQLYTGLELNQPKREASFELGWYTPTFKRLVLHLRNRTYWLDQPNYFENDLLQVGGSRSIRGFNENQFFTNFYTFFTGEYRFLLEQNSYLFVFGDYAYLENAVSDEVLRPFGFGAGLTYDTKVGMVSVTYAIGKSGNFALQPGRGRVHIGMINQF